MSRPDGLPRREPIFNIPRVIIVCCGALLLIHAGRGVLSNEADNDFIAYTALVPARFALALHVMPDRLSAAYRGLTDHNPFLAPQIAFLIGDGGARPWTLATYALIHATWAHVGFNCLWLVAFGSMVARRFATFRFLVLLLVTAIVGALVQVAVNPTSFAVIIGASAAVSGAMGAATRFAFRPRHQTLAVLEDFRRGNYAQPALTLKETFTTRITVAFIVFWFASNLLFGIFPSLSGVADGPIAWQAHIGGFVAGLLLFSAFDPKVRPVVGATEDGSELPSAPDEIRSAE